MSKELIDSIAGFNRGFEQPATMRSKELIAEMSAEFAPFQERLEKIIADQMQSIATARETLFCNALRAHLKREPTFADAQRCTIAKYEKPGSSTSVEHVFYDDDKLGVLITELEEVRFIPESK